MIKTAQYKLELRLNGQLIGDLRNIAQNLKWSRCRTNYGIDEIDFTLNDQIFAKWCEDRNTSIDQIMKPYALDIRVVRNGEAVAGGFLATRPAYNPHNASADLEFRFDGYLNLLAGVYIHPTATVTKRADLLVQDWITLADTRATTAGKAYGFVYDSTKSTQLASVQRTFDNYESVKEAITKMTDNMDGAGIFDVIFEPDRKYYITNQLGRDITSWQLYYPPRLAGQSVATISADEVQGFASHIITLGAGETSADPAKSTVITSEATNAEAVAEFGYVEALTQYSSVSKQSTLDHHCAADLRTASNCFWEPNITLTGSQTPPSPTEEYGIWIGDTIYLENTADPTGATSGWFRIQAIEVSVSANGAESITPIIERTAA
jgi:hypothetical protein